MFNQKLLKKITDIEKKVEKSRSLFQKTVNINHIMKTIKALPALRDVLTLESVPLKPMVMIMDDDIVLFIIFSKQAKTDAFEPWLCVSINVNKKEVLILKAATVFSNDLLKMNSDCIASQDWCNKLQTYLDKKQVHPEVGSPLDFYYSKFIIYCKSNKNNYKKYS